MVATSEKQGSSNELIAQSTLWQRIQFSGPMAEAQFFACMI